MWLTFGLDRIAALRYAPFADIPLWRYVSSLACITLAFVSITYVLLRAVDAALRAWQERSRTPDSEPVGKQLLPLIGKSVKVFIIVVALLVTSQNLGLNVTGLIASLSVGVLAVDLAAQDTLANLFGAVAILIGKPFSGSRARRDTGARDGGWPHASCPADRPRRDSPTGRRP